MSWFANYLRREGITWPVLPSGQLDLKDTTFRDMCRLHPKLKPLKDLRHFVDKLKLEELTVGNDGGNRVSLMPFGAKTGRNTPSNKRFIFGPSRWVRHLIKPTEGRALAYIDWSSQEVAIAAVLSGDLAMLEAIQSGDPYLASGRG